MRRHLLAFVFATMPACSYIFDLPETASAISSEAGHDAFDEFVHHDVVPPPAFCASQTEPNLLCEDFDEVAAPDPTTLGTPKVKDGQLVVANAISLSPGRSLFSAVTGTDSAAAVVHPLNASPDGITLSSDMLVSVWSAPDSHLNQIELVDGPLLCDVRIIGGATTWQLLQVCAKDGIETARVVTDSTKPIVTGEWHRLALTLAFAPTTLVTLTIDGEKAVDAPGLADLHASATSIAYGIEGSTTGIAVLYQDNVLVTSP